MKLNREVDYGKINDALTHYHDARERREVIDRFIDEATLHIHEGLNTRSSDSIRMGLEIDLSVAYSLGAIAMMMREYLPSER